MSLFIFRYVAKVFPFPFAIVDTVSQPHWYKLFPKSQRSLPWDALSLAQCDSFTFPRRNLLCVGLGRSVFAPGLKGMCYVLAQCRHSGYRVGKKLHFRRSEAFLIFFWGFPCGWKKHLTPSPCAWLSLLSLSLSLGYVKIWASLYLVLTSIHVSPYYVTFYYSNSSLSWHLKATEYEFDCFFVLLEEW